MFDSVPSNTAEVPGSSAESPRDLEGNDNFLLVTTAISTSGSQEIVRDNSGVSMVHEGSGLRHGEGSGNDAGARQEATPSAGAAGVTDDHTESVSLASVDGTDTGLSAMEPRRSTRNRACPNRSGEWVYF